MSNEIGRLAFQNKENVDWEIMDAIEKEWLVVPIINNYTIIHSRHQPDNAKDSVACVMCISVCRIFTGIPDIPLLTIECLRCPSEIDVTSLTQGMFSLATMNAFSNAYTNTMQGWIPRTSFDPEYGKNHLNVHA